MDFRQVLGTSNRRRLELIELLYYNREGSPSERLLTELNCSLPILLNDISVIHAQQDIFTIEKEKGLYRVKLKEDISIGRLYSEALTHSPEFQIIEQLLYETCDNIESLSKLLFLSFSNTQRYLKKIESALNRTGIKLCYRPLRLEGKESLIRHFYYRYFIERQYTLRTVLPELKAYQSKAIEKFVSAFITRNDMHKKYIFQKRMSYNVFISLWRIKNGHSYQEEELRKEGLVLPEKRMITAFRDTISDVFQLELTDELMRDCLWLSFSDSLVFSEKHRKAARRDNPRYRFLFDAHFSLVKKFNTLLAAPSDEARLLELTTVLVNDIYLYDEEGVFLTILRKSRTVFLRMVRLMHRQAVEKVTALVHQFVEEYAIYQDNDFIVNYVYLLLTQEVDSLELLASRKEKVHLLLISDLSPTEEAFIAKVITQIVYGNFEIHHLDEGWDEEKDLYKKIIAYDGLITTGSREGLPKEFPIVSMDPYVTPQAIVEIQQLVSKLSGK